MARTVLTKQALTAPLNPTAGTLLVWTAADTTNFNSFAASGKELILAWNTHASTAYTVTITSAPDPVLGRTKDITAESLLAGEIHCFGVPQVGGWQQTDGSIYLQSNNASVKFCVISLP